MSFITKIIKNRSERIERAKKAADKASADAMRAANAADDAARKVWGLEHAETWELMDYEPPKSTKGTYQTQFKEKRQRWKGGKKTRRSKGTRKSKSKSKSRSTRKSRSKSKSTRRR